MNRLTTASESLPASSDALREPHLFRFGLGRMLASVALAAALLAAVTQTPGPWPVLILSAAGLVGAHVLGTLLGTRLRDTSSEVSAWNRSRGIEPASRSGSDRFHPSATIIPAASRSLLANCEADSRRRNYGAACGGAAAGLLGGAAVALSAGGASVTWAGVGLIAVSGGVLGGWAALLASGFLVVGRRAWRDAVALDPPADRAATTGALPTPAETSSS